MRKIVERIRLPETKNIEDLNHPSTTLLHAKIIQKKYFLKNLYIDFYDQFRKSLPKSIENKFLVELGSGGGFIKEIIPSVVTSDITPLPYVDKCFSATNMPYKDCTIDAFFMIDVFHHINDIRAFFKEANRCLKVGGKLVMIEPANTVWGRFIYKNFHHEPFVTSGGWSLKDGYPLSSANGAIPWIIFFRDRLLFEKEFPSLVILDIKYHTPFRYLISGGVSFYQLLPSFLYDMIRRFEVALSPFNKYIGMFLTIEITKSSS